MTYTNTQNSQLTASRWMDPGNGSEPYPATTYSASSLAQASGT